MDNVISLEDAAKLITASSEDSHEVRGGELPPFPEELMNMPAGLGLLQDFIYNRMVYPNRALAGYMALATLTPFVQAKLTVKSQQGLGLHNWFMPLLPTGYGKEGLRSSISDLAWHCFGREGMSTHLEPAQARSAQGLHRLFQGDEKDGEGGNNSQFLMSDEFSTFVAGSSESYTHECLFYCMETYGRCYNPAKVGAIVGAKYREVYNPRLSIFATSTEEAVFGSMNRAQADAGAWNRWMIFVDDGKVPEKRYTGIEFDPSEELKDFIHWAHNQQDEGERNPKIKFTPEGFQRYQELDQSLAEPVKQDNADGPGDLLLGGRLGEHSIKIAALVALAHRRLVIEPQDIEMGFKIRLGLYKRSKAAVDRSGALEEGSMADLVRVQIIDALKKNKKVYGSRIEKYARKFKKLSERERQSVLDLVVGCRACAIAWTKDANFVLTSQIYEEK